MTCSLDSDGFRMYMGDKKVPMEPVPYPRPVLKLVALWAPMPWPHGFKTMPALDQQAGGTRPQDFAQDTQALRDLTERFVKLPKNFAWPPHPHFGSMNYKEWMRLAYLHADHHLRQFGA